MIALSCPIILFSVHLLGVVGLSSYLDRFLVMPNFCGGCGVKAFMVNRLSDFGFLCGIILLWSMSDIGNVQFSITDFVGVIPHLDLTC